ncbi:MAG: T9SS type A sorting domain-containing protein [Candidatus Cloacimonetes bacterium]|nr:T9SS type A sorting domain-containing protein [Candidatus Cloacimonadota bacterium]
MFSGIKSHRYDGSENKQLLKCENDLIYDPTVNNEGEILFSKQISAEVVKVVIMNKKLKVQKNDKLRNSLIKKTFQMVRNKNARSNISVPYVNQSYDSPNGYAHAYGCCAAATATMAIMYYNTFPHWDTTNSLPYSHTTHWGNFIAETIYQYRGVVYDNVATYTSGAGTCYYGIDNYHWDGGSPNSRMRQLIENHGIAFVQHWTSSCTYARISGDVNNDYPYPICVTMTASGHLILAKGIYNDASKLMYYHDPYGDKNTSPYKDYNGDDVIYDWSGENNGYANLVSVAWSVSNQNTHQATVGLEVDDLQLAYGSNFEDYVSTNTGFYLYTGGTSGMRYWRGETGGQNGTYWWTGGMSGTTDDYYASWRPNITESGNYEVEVYIPNETTVVSNARYQIYHNDGSTLVEINQSANLGTWVSLGEFDFSNDDSGYIYLGDAIGSKFSGKSKKSDDRAYKILFDEVRFNLIEGNSVTIFDNDFETNDGGLSENMDWTWGSDSTTGANSGSNVWGTVLNANYNDQSDITLDLSVSLGENSILTFYHWMQIEDVSKAIVYDGANLKISTNGGSNFDIIIPNGGYPHTITYSIYNPLSNEEGFSGISTGWEEVIFDLTAYNNQNVIIRWHFGTDGATTEHGWYIDDVNITSYPEQPLPVSLSSFAGTFQDNCNILCWTTQTEINNSHWNLYRSVSENFGQSYKINSEAISGAGSTSQPTNYEFVDNSTDFLNSIYYYWLESVNFSGNTELYGFFEVAIPIQDNPQVPDISEIGLSLKNYPNPFNPSTTISFNLITENIEEAKIKIYNIKGQEIKKFGMNDLRLGMNHIVWDGTDESNKPVSSGSYFYKLIADGKMIEANKCLLIK